MIRIAPEYEHENPKVSETFENEAAFAQWFETAAMRHANWNFINTHVSKASYSTSNPEDVLQTLYLACDHHGLPRKHKKKAEDKLKTKRVWTKSIKDGCKAKIIKKTFRDGQVSIECLWQHDTHQPEKVQDMVRSRLPAEVKQWIVSHVDNNMDWKAIKTLLRIDPRRLEEVLEAGLAISSFPMSLRINYHDVQNVINTRLNKLSRRNAVDRTSVEEWMSFLKNEKGCLVHMKFYEGNGPYLLSWISPWQKKILEAADEWCIDSTHKTCKSLVGSDKHSYLYMIVLTWVQSNCDLRVKRIMIGCSPVEMSALKDVFGQSFQVLCTSGTSSGHGRCTSKKDGIYVKITGATHESKKERDAVRVGLNLLMHAKSELVFEQKYQEFLSRFSEHGKFIEYIGTQWHSKRELWSMTRREEARFHTNNLVESYHHILKAYYLGSSRNFWVDRQEGLKIIYGFKKLVLTHTEKAKKKAQAIAYKDTLGMVETIEDNSIYKCRSFADNSVWYELLIKEEVLSTCSCPNPNHLCKRIFFGLQDDGTSERKEVNAAAQDKLRCLEFTEIQKSLLKKIEQAVEKRNVMSIDIPSGMDVSVRILRDCLSSLEEAEVAPQQRTLQFYHPFVDENYKVQMNSNCLYFVAIKGFPKNTATLLLIGLI
ncbi:hypothetical protein PHYBLDRAFT_68949 [Phycomyces blakesleeanus NRRL 1555(-)]|uniref:SWIM-type domain-containing protein n=1 Tax=Phycomyces blakesleeanus (strain ATCC 8743b / DSM 1359 / FGSC 10004 / NBRC 33097 / NRRL 1555) TaxID=763407 RepID=A0A167KLY4_PHYB8|nr:hypothetical protein PHYBLDRAFT_68949 [Phycomyces blakesleeanus NRRL 1555(-)]OAD68396.1 hypothetical protein PHYBLDRAFT_68949 [Phycomyces blakesleeanus NRRL 1555(-)]|eukprot:XP_018286436.1 hypothetical protein PHYBLDRAFT_68949 [Phycomyces blakesleeanus NRRL 1555(-)]